MAEGGQGGGGRLLINPIIYTEISIAFDEIEELDELLPETVFHREVLPWNAAFLAGKAFRANRRRGGAISALAGLLHRSACCGAGLQIANAGCGTVPDMLSDTQPDHAVKRYV